MRLAVPPRHGVHSMKRRRRAWLTMRTCTPTLASCANARLVVGALCRCAVADRRPPRAHGPSERARTQRLPGATHRLRSSARPPCAIQIQQFEEFVVGPCLQYGITDLQEMKVWSERSMHGWRTPPHPPHPTPPVRLTRATHSSASRAWTGTAYGDDQDRRLHFDQSSDACDAEMARYCGLSKKALSKNRDIEVRPRLVGATASPRCVCHGSRCVSPPNHAGPRFTPLGQARIPPRERRILHVSQRAAHEPQAGLFGEGAVVACGSVLWIGSRSLPWRCGRTRPCPQMLVHMQSIITGSDSTSVIIAAFAPVQAEIAAQVALVRTVPLVSHCAPAALVHTLNRTH